MDTVIILYGIIHIISHFLGIIYNLQMKKKFKMPWFYILF